MRLSSQTRVAATLSCVTVSAVSLRFQASLVVCGSELCSVVAGVLDVDELQIVAKTPKKPLQFPSIEIPEFSRPPIVPGNSTVFPGARAGQPSVQAQEFKVGLLEEEGCFDVPDMKLGDHLDLEENLLESDVNPVYKQVPMLCVSPAGCLRLR